MPARSKDRLPAQPLIDWLDQEVARYEREDAEWPTKMVASTLGWTDRTLRRYRSGLETKRVNGTNVEQATDSFPRVAVEDALTRAGVPLWQVYGFDVIDPGPMFDRYCPTCKEEVTVGEDAICPWCETPTLEKEARRRYRKSRRGVARKMTDDQVRELHRRYEREGLSCRALGREVWQQFGYRSAQSCGESIYKAFVDLGLPRRSQREVTITRNLKHGRKRRKQTNEEQVAYRHWYAQQRGWRRVQGPGRPDCKGIKTGARGGKGKPCTRGAQEGSEYCWVHDPEREQERQALLRRVRARQRPQEVVPVEPFAAWVESLYMELGTLGAVAEVLECSKSTVSNYVTRRRSTPAGRAPAVAIERRRVETYLARASEVRVAPTFADLYEAEPVEALAA